MYVCMQNATNVGEGEGRLVEEVNERIRKYRESKEQRIVVHTI